MANTLSKNNITDGNAIEAWNVTQSVDAFTGIAPYNITISGSLDINEAPITNLTASIISASVGITGSLFGVASTSSYVLAANIFQPFTNLTASGDINVTAITASEYIGLPSGLVSGSPQIPSLLPSGVVSGSAQIPSLLPSARMTLLLYSRMIRARSGCTFIWSAEKILSASIFAFKGAASRWLEWDETEDVAGSWRGAMPDNKCSSLVPSFFLE